MEGANATGVGAERNDDERMTDRTGRTNDNECELYNYLVVKEWTPAETRSQSKLLRRRDAGAVVGGRRIKIESHRDTNRRQR